MCLVACDLVNDTEMAKLLESMQNLNEVDKLIIASAFMSLENAQKLKNTWRSQTQKELNIICYCLGGSTVVDGARKSLAQEEGA